MPSVCEEGSSLSGSGMGEGWDCLRRIPPPPLISHTPAAKFPHTHRCFHTLPPRSPKSSPSTSTRAACPRSTCCEWKCGKLCGNCLSVTELLSPCLPLLILTICPCIPVCPPSYPVITLPSPPPPLCLRQHYPYLHPHCYCPSRTVTAPLTLLLPLPPPPSPPSSTIYTQCFTFPEKLIFFLTAQLKVCVCVGGGGCLAVVPASPCSLIA